MPIGNRAVTTIFVACLLMVGCAGSSSSATTSQSSTAALGSPSAQPSGSLGQGAVKLELTQVATGFSRPLFVTNAGDGSNRLFVVEQAGRVKVLSANNSTVTSTFLDISDRVASGGERGLLGLAFSPDFTTDHQLFVDYTDLNGDTVISRFLASNDQVDPGSEEIVLNIDQPAANHNGGWIGFGPDRMLYVAMGDGGGGNSQNGQRLDTLLGKILRIDVLGGSPYRIPAGNRGLGPNARPEIWLYGLRNPWRDSFDRETGDLFIGDVGAGTQEELDAIPRGQSGLNLGWPLAEGTRCAEPCPSGLTPPFYGYSHDIGSVVTGGYVYRGAQYPTLRGLYIFGDYARGTVSTVPAARALQGSATPVEALDTGFLISSFGEDESGELYLTDLSGGGIYHISTPTR